MGQFLIAERVKGDLDQVCHALILDRSAGPSCTAHKAEAYDGNDRCGVLERHRKHKMRVIPINCLYHCSQMSRDLTVSAQLNVKLGVLCARYRLPLNNVSLSQNEGTRALTSSLRRG